MRRQFGKLVTLAFLGLVLVGTLKAALPFLFWVPAAERANKFDPKSPKYIPTNADLKDSYDPMDNTIAGANNLGSPSTTLGSIANRYVDYPSDSVDWYKYTFTAGLDYTFQAIRTAGAGTMTITIYDSSGTVQYSSDTAAPTATVSYNSAGGGTYLVKITSSSPVTYTYTYQQATPQVPTDTFTLTDTRTYTNTNTYTFTKTYTNTKTFTNTYTPPPGATNTFTPTPVPGGHTALVTDFENHAADDRTLWDTSAQTIDTSLDALGSTMTQSPWGVGKGSAPGAGNSSNYAGCIDGNLLQDGPPYPYAQMVLSLIAGGGLTNGSGTFVDVTPYSPNHGFTFKYKANSTGVTYRVQFIQNGITDYAHFCYEFTPADTNWHTQEVYFPGYGTPALAAPYATAFTFDPTHIGAIAIYPKPKAGVAQAYNICVDDITFTVSAAPTATPTPAGGHTSLVCDFEDITSDNKTLWDGSAQTVDTSLDAIGSTMTQNPWAAGKSVAPGAGNSSNYAACIDGNLLQDGPPYPYAQLVLSLIVGGGLTNGTGTYVNVNPYSPNHGIKFDYKATVSGVTYRMQFIQNGITDYAHFCYEFTPTDTNWHTQTVYFPGYGTPALAAPYATAFTFDPTHIGAIAFYPKPMAGVAQSYGLCVDNVDFGAPAPAPTPTPAGGVYKFEDFESAINGGYQYSDTGGSSITYAENAASAHAGTNGVQANVTTATGAGTYGCGFGFLTNYPTSGTLVDATGATGVRFWMKSDKPLSFVIQWMENNMPNPPGDPTNELWVSNTQNLVTTGSWQQFDIPWSAFSESPYNGQCNPTGACGTCCATTGNGTMDLGVVAEFQFQFTNATPVSGATVYMDDIEFHN